MSTPVKTSSPPAVEKIRASIKRVFYAVIALVVLGVITWQLAIRHTSPEPVVPAKAEEFKLPSVATPVADRPSFIVPAKGEVYVPIPVGKSIHWEGSVGTRYEYTHQNGCPAEGCLVGVYFTNGGSAPVTVTLAYN